MTYLEARITQVEQILNDHRRELDVQLQRIAQLQADLDEIRGAWVKVKSRRR